MKNKALLKAQLMACFSDVFETPLINELAEHSLHRYYNKGDIVVDLEMEMTHIPIILNGLVKVTREDIHENEILLYFLEEGDTCACSIINCISKQKSIIRATTEVKAEIIEFPVSKIEEWMIKYKSWRVYVIDSYHHRLEELLVVIKNLAFKNLDNRLYAYLSHQAKIRHTEDLSITHREIATDLNTSRVVISRILKMLDQKGKIKLSRHNIHVFDA
ncbi:Crp/Fnr family transcriptional regulator [Seonamhaeicola maritimus]|uniref:Crp/Fnr family transcriptional regulator n=1 Tax=Seonamhaeicola maritimus TaxID=2591822 RepID=UPI002494435C|nr:Crp/Fnr family transcriptional regulator [Seonamhaeicola maritimus]